MLVCVDCVVSFVDVDAILRIRVMLALCAVA